MNLTLIITAYNVEEFIGKCLDSVERQTYRPHQILVVDDASTDSTLSKIKEWASGKPHVEILELEKNLGAGGARNEGLKKASGDFVMFLDSDDWISPEFIEELVTEQSRTNSDIVSGGITIMKLEGGRRADSPAPHISRDLEKFQDYLGDQRIIFLNNKIVRKSLYDEIGGYCVRRYCEDTPVVVPLLYNANQVANIDNPGYYYRQRPTSLCHMVTPFQEHLFKGLCSIDLLRFFADKPAEYRPLVPVQEFLTHVKGLKSNMATLEEFEKYESEFAKVMRFFLTELVNFNDGTKEQPAPAPEANS